MPSVARIIPNRAAVAPTPPIGSTGRCIEVQGGAAVHDDLWTGTCDGSASQSWTSSTADRSLRSLGKCTAIMRSLPKRG